MPKSRNVGVVRGRFGVEEQRKSEILVPPTTQRKAIRIARIIAQANRSELIIQAKEGRIRSKDSDGNDGFPPRG